MKIGGCLITDKSAEKPTLDRENIFRICDEISYVFHNKDIKIILIHGAGSYGHPLAKSSGLEHGVKTEEHLKCFALAQSLQNELDVFFCNALIERNVPAIPVQASSSAVMRNKTLIHMDIDAVKGFLKLGLVPVLYGVPAYDEENGCSILSGDQIMSYLAKKLGIKKMVFATDVNGIYDSDPKKNKDASLIKNINRENIGKIIDNVSGSIHSDASGGMLGKVKELMKLKEIECNIINGNEKGNIKKILLGENIGTRVIF